MFAALQHREPDQVPRFEIWIDPLFDEPDRADPVSAYVNLGQDCLMMPTSNPPESNAWRDGVDEWGRVWRKGLFVDGVVDTVADLERYSPRLYYVEGVAGVLNHDDWVLPGKIFYIKGMRLLTEEVNAAIEGFCSAGAEEIMVADGHGAGGIDPENLDERALLRRGREENDWPCGLDRSFAGLAFVGQHAKAGTPYSHITHTQWFNYIDLCVNGVSIGEYGQVALCAMELGIPTILACGEEALCREAETLTPGVITVSGKRGLLPDGLDDLDTESYRKAKLSAIHKPPKSVRALIRDGAAAALQKLKRNPSAFRYQSLTTPFTRTIRFRQNGDIAPYETTDEHADSIIGLMNLPIASGPKMAGQSLGCAT